MNERKQRLLSVVEVLTSMLRTIQLRRTFSAVSPTPTLVMWRVIYGNLTDMAVLEWCKLFGSDDDIRPRLESVYFYYDFVVAELRKNGIDQQHKDLRAYGAEFAAQCRDIAATAMGATRSFEERVY